MNITYGHKVESVADPLVTGGDQATGNTVTVPGPGTLMVDLVPIRMSLAVIMGPYLNVRRAQ